MTENFFPGESAETITDRDLYLSNGEVNSIMATFYFVRIHDIGGEPLEISELESSVKNHFSKNDIPIQQNGLSGSMFVDSFDHYRFFYLTRIDAVLGSPDTLTIQIGLSSVLPSGEAWESLRLKLREILEEWYVKPRSAVSSKASLLGYSLIYKGNIPATSSANPPDQSLFKELQPLFSQESARTNLCLGSKSYANGQINLLSVSNDLSRPSCNIYLVLTISGTRSSLLRDQFFLNNRQLLMAEAFVHKSDFQWRQLKGEHYAEFNSAIISLQKKSKELLKRDKRKFLKDRYLLLDEIAELYAQILGPYGEYQELELSLLKQIKNLEFKQEADTKFYREPNDILSFLIEIISRKHVDFSLAMERCKIAIEQTQLVIDIAEAKQAKLTEKRLNHLQVTLAQIGIGLAIIQVLDETTLNGILKSAGYNLTHSHFPAWLVFLSLKLGIALSCLFLTNIVYYLLRYVAVALTKRNQ